MRVLTVSELKEGRGAKHAHRDYPLAGSAARAIFDQLAAHKGRVVSLGRANDRGIARGQAIRQLEDFYGCDIRKAKGRNNYILAGEWFGSHYSDYVVQAIAAAERVAA